MNARSPRRVWRPVAALLLVVLTATGCSTTVAGNGAQAVARGGGDVRTANQLAAILMDVPDGARESTTAFDADRTPTLDEFAKGYYSAGSGADHLRQLGVTTVAHEGWTAGSSDAAEVVLFLFTDHDAAYTWMSGETSALREAGAQRAALDEVPSVVGYMFTQFSSGGLQDRRFYAIQGRVGMVFNHYATPGSGPGVAPAWVGAQYQRMQ